jgi:uncharacterized protein (TIGR02453 family)
MTRRFSGFPEEGLNFLKGLKRHNKRPWFQARKSIYEDAVKDPLDEFILTLARDFEDFAPEFVASPKTSRYRIYRDTRFSANKAPYKTHAAAVFPRRSLDKHQGAGFYIHIDPQDSFVGGGLFRPMPKDLFALREHIANQYQELEGLLSARSFRRLFGEVGGDMLVRVPRGFRKDHPAGDLLRHKQFLASHRIDPIILTTPGLHTEVVKCFKALLPLLRFINEPIVGLNKQTLGEQPVGPRAGSF